MGNPEKNIELENAVCPVCQTDEFSFIMEARSMDHLTAQAFKIVKCEQCGLLLTNPRPTTASISNFYESGLYETEEGAVKHFLVNPVMNRFHRLRFRTVSRKKSQGKILDIGCGKGKFLAVAAGQGWEAWGIEPSQRSRSLAEGGTGARIYGGRFEDADLPDNYFDAVTMWHTLEHFHDPLGTLLKAGEKLKEDGVLIIRVPNSDSWDFKIGKNQWFHLDAPRHLYHFSPESLKNLLVKAGFKPVALSTASLEDNPVGTLQTMMAKVGFAPGSMFRLIKGNLGEREGRGKPLTAISVVLAASVLALPSLIFSEAAQATGHGGAITVVAVKKSEVPTDPNDR